jgi:cbb3-type cytochrome oxidase maturation protein
MDILYMLVPLSVVLVFLIVGVLAWSVRSGQFDDVGQEGARILEDDDASPRTRPHAPLDPDQATPAAAQHNENEAIRESKT